MFYHKPKLYWNLSSEYFGRWPRHANPYDANKVTGYDILNQLDDEMGGYKSDPDEFKHLIEELDKKLDEIREAKKEKNKDAGYHHLNEKYGKINFETKYQDSYFAEL